MAAASSSTDTPPLGKYLASTDKSTRDRAIKNLSAFLSDPARDVLPKSEMAKLWKGIFYCFWMSDKPLVQQALATELAEILLSINSPAVSMSFLCGFWEATVREWNSIDRLRIDKYYMLVRRFVNASFRLLLRNEWDQALCEEYNQMLSGHSGPLCPDDIRVPASLAYHLADIYLEELDKALGNTTVSSPLPTPLSTFLGPFLSLAARTPTTATYLRIQSALFEPLFSALSPQNADSDEPRRHKRPRLSTPTYPHLVANACATHPKSEGALPGGKLRKLLLRQLFEVASEEGTRDANRRKMYAFRKNNMDDDEASDSDSDSGGETTANSS